MRFMTYNIRLGVQRGLDPVIDLLRETRPDVLALQEVGSHWSNGPAGDTTRRIALQVGLDHAIFVPTVRSGPTIRYGHALLSRWPLLESDRRLFATRGDEPRAALVADVAAPERSVRVVATHLSHIDSNRELQGPELCDLVSDSAPNPEETEAPLVVAGDLNERRDRPAPWMRDLLDDFDTAARNDPAPTFENPLPDVRIDYLLVKGCQWSSARVLDRPDLSDHRPVVADL